MNGELRSQRNRRTLDVIVLALLQVMPSPTTCGGTIMFFGRPSVVCPLFVRNTYFAWRDISMKLVTNIYHVSGRCWNVFEVKGQFHLIIVCQLYYSNSYLYSPEGAIIYIQICECESAEEYISKRWRRGWMLVLTRCLHTIATLEH